MRGLCLDLGARRLCQCHAMPRRRRPIPPDSSPRERALDVLALMRRQGLSLRGASDLARTDPRTVRRHAGQALRRGGRRWAATPYDRIPREMTALTHDGPVAVIVRDSRTASLLASHANAVARYVERGDEDALRPFRGRIVRIRGQPVALETDPTHLDRLARGAELSYELYRS
jgi:hypothetical protein